MFKFRMIALALLCSLSAGASTRYIDGDVIRSSNRGSTWTFPSQGPLVVTSATQTLTNKTIDANLNTLLNLPNSSQAIMANSTIKCNVSGSPAVPQDCTGGQVGTVLGALLGANNLSDVTNAGTSRTNLGLGTIATKSQTVGSGVQKGDGSGGLTAAVAGTDYQAPLPALANNSVVFTDGAGKLTSGWFTGDVAINNSTVTIQPAVVTNAKLATMANSTIKCNVSGGSASPSDCTGGQVGTIIGALIGPSPGSTYGGTLVSNGAAWINSTVAIPACSALAGTVVDWSLGNCFTKSLTANTTLTMTNRVAGQTVVLRIRNTAANYTLTFPNTDSAGNSVLWSSSTIPALSAGGAKSDIFTIFFDGTEMYGNAVQNFGSHP